MHKWFTGALAVEQVQIAIADLPSRLKGLQLVHLSDFHFDGIRLSETLLNEAIALTNDFHPDLILLTGDFVTDIPNPIHALAPRLAALQSRSGTYAVLGNHDLRYPHSQREVTQALIQNGVHVLWNDIVYPVGEELAIVGLADFWSKEFKPRLVFSQVSETIPRLVLSHNPDSAELLQQWRVDLQLSGHTHGGQVHFPGLGNMAHRISEFYRNLPKEAQRYAPFLRSCAKTMRHWEWAQGLHQVGANQLYVNRGLGTYLPGRFLCPPELTVITLV